TLLVKQFRYPIEQEIWQFPMGTLNIEEDPAVHAAEEFRQETGAVAQKLTLMGEFFVDPGLSRQKCLVFVAEGVIESGLQELEESELGLQSRMISIAQFETMLSSGELNDAWGYAGAHFLHQYLKEHPAPPHGEVDTAIPIRPLRESDQQEWMRLRFALW